MDSISLMDSISMTSWQGNWHRPTYLKAKLMRKTKNLVDPGELVSEKSLHKSYKILGQGEGIERLLVKNKKDVLEEVEGDCDCEALQFTTRQGLDLAVEQMSQIEQFGDLLPRTALISCSSNASFDSS